MAPGIMGRRGRALTTGPKASQREYDAQQVHSSKDDGAALSRTASAVPGAAAAGSQNAACPAGYVLLLVHFTPVDGRVQTVQVPARYDTKMTDVFHSICHVLNSRFRAGLAYHKIGLAVCDGGDAGTVPSPSPVTPPQVSLGERAASNIQVKSEKAGATSFSQCGAAFIATEKQSARAKVVNFLKTKLRRKGKGDEAELTVPKEFRNTILFATDHPLHHVPYVAWCIAAGRPADFNIAMTAAPPLQHRRLASPQTKTLSVVTPPKGF
eukprot:TRINITY_DN15825_c0_g1_i1.p1 TRINITY_DN15825_c0_g1~~TRINITY_DN15825_c0_g1_i1.p1  ORF type:complete len:285 (+),score=109.15 TRINITY_DN15825_c0_g1_i1:56-856(+)